jgi:pimeloyl-ACP methyl ester carboxylesterase
VILAPGFTVKASSFAIDTVGENLVEFLAGDGYDVWLFDYRASPDSGSDITLKFTIDDIAAIDWPAAVEFVKQTARVRDVQVLAHCVGSMSLLMALLQGMTGVRSVISSALTLHPVTNWLSYLKADLDVSRIMAGVTEFEHGFDIVPGKTQFEHQVDFMAWNMPVPEGEGCRNPVCRRIFSIFGPSYTHAQLDHGTHTAMQDMFGLIPIAPFDHLSLMMKRQRAVDHTGADRYLDSRLAHNLKLPITFITGALNQIFDPETIARTYQWVVKRNGASYYDKKIFENYAHMDLFIGRTAAADVFPFLLDRLELHAVAEPLKEPWTTPLETLPG